MTQKLVAQMNLQAEFCPNSDCRAKYIKKREYRFTQAATATLRCTSCGRTYAHKQGTSIFGLLDTVHKITCTVGGIWLSIQATVAAIDQDMRTIAR